MIFRLVPVILLLLSCHSKHKKELAGIPYPILTDQRSELAGKSHVKPVRMLDSVHLIGDLEFLSSAQCQGRRPGSAGHELARQYIMQRMRSIGLDSLGASMAMDSSGPLLNGSSTVQNVVGLVKGTHSAEQYIVLTAHYDHLGMTKEGGIFYGADDNASGTACLLAMAEYFKQHPADYTMIFAAVDREETGLNGSFELVDGLLSTIDKKNILINLNMDMIARSDKDEIFACGVRYTPSLASVIEEVRPKTNVNILMGHDGLVKEEDDWTVQSDHLAFYKKHIPFLYLGVEDHPDYHRPSDTADKINYGRYLENSNMIAMLAIALNTDWAKPGKH